jgi:hypothetical protein
MPPEFLCGLVKNCIDDYLNAPTPEKKEHASHVLRGAIAALGLKLVMDHDKKMTPAEIERQLELSSKGFDLLNVDGDKTKQS